MKVVILTAGSRGDVQPFVALGQGLQGAGHEVTLCTAATFEGFIRDNGLNYAHMDDELLKLKDTSEGRSALEGKGGKLALMKKVKPMLRRMLDDCWNAAQGAEALVYHPKTLAGAHIAERLNVATFMSMPLPLYTPTREFPAPIVSWQLGGWFNKQSHKIVRLIAAPFAGIINDWRVKALGLPRRNMWKDELKRADGSLIPALYCYSPHVIPQPADWPASAVATGYWFLEEGRDWTPSAELLRFLEAGAPPVYIGFGSMAGTDPEGKAKLVLEALRLSGQRGLIASGWGGLRADSLPENVHMIEAAPHDWLFPRMAAVVHHGGAGTTAAGIRAGRPTIICPFMGDQFFWGNRVHELGIGPAPIPQKKLTAEILAQAIREATRNGEMLKHAETLGAKVRAENGVERAVHIISRQLSPVAQYA